MQKFLSAVIAAAALWLLAFSCEARGQDRTDYLLEAKAMAVQGNKPLAVMVGTEVRKIAGVTTVQVDSLEGYPARCVVIHMPDGKGDVIATTFRNRGESVALFRGSVLPIAATDADINAVAFPAKEVSQPAPRFTQRSSRETADGDPWLSREETEKIKALWPKSVPWNDNIKWYNLRPVYQSLTTMNGGRTKVNTITSIFDRDTLSGDGAALTVSGGMDGHNFRSIKGIDFAGKKVIVWQEDTDVRAFALVPRWRWQFVPGQAAYDVLLNDDGKPFEVRKQTRVENRKWETDILYKEAAFRPVGYNGLKQSCASCHNLTAEVVDVPGRIYRRTRWGDDGRFSWRPFDDAAQLDMRWPIEVQ